jgi:hypothetical protein
MKPTSRSRFDLDHPLEREVHIIRETDFGGREGMILSLSFGRAWAFLGVR